jgi:hypothetical protein
MANAVDEFISKKVRPEQRGIVREIRRLMREFAPDAEEGIAYGILVWRGRKIFAVANPYKDGITFSFTHGTEFEDKYGLLRGRGKVGRHIKIKSVEEIKPAVLKYYIRQALKRDKQ